jgi:hypothetical protein
MATLTVIVTGGCNDASTYLDSTEFLNLDSNLWTSGRKLQLQLFSEYFDPTTWAVFELQLLLGLQDQVFLKIYMEQ